MTRCLLVLLLVALPAAAQGLIEGGASARSVVDVAAKDEPVRDVLARIVSSTRARIVVGPEVDRKVTLRLRQVSWRDAVREVTRQAKLTVEELPGGVLRVTQPPRTSVQLQEADARVALLLLSRLAGRNIVIGPDVRGQVTLDLKDVTWDTALRAVASLVEATVVDAADLVVVGQRAGAAAPEDGDHVVVAGTLAERRKDDQGRDQLVVHPDERGSHDVLLTLPAGPAGDRLRAALEGVAAGARLVAASGPDGLVRHVVVTR